MTIHDDPIPPEALQMALQAKIDDGTIQVRSGHKGHKWLADRVGVSPVTVRSWATGERNLTGPAAQMVRIVLEVGGRP
jgi:hypothetical protein